MRPQHITAENGPIMCTMACAGGRFNEAAAYHCGKHARVDAIGVSVGRFNEAAAYHCGKHFTSGASSGAGGASMRPQHITAENARRRRVRGARGRASMRPQHITAENSSSSVYAAVRFLCFNEAAAYHCGKPRLVAVGDVDGELQ